jgi:hypothetical protein
LKNNVINILSPKIDELTFTSNVLISYSVDNIDINFKSIKLFLNGTLVHTSNKTKEVFSVMVNQGDNLISAYCVNKFDEKIVDTDIERPFENILFAVQKDETISEIVQYQLSEFIRTDYPKFIDFIKTYYEFLETSNDPRLIPYNLENYINLDTVPDFVLDKLKQYLMQDFTLNYTKDTQTNLPINDKNIIKNIKEFFDSKGTEDSIKFIMRLLHDVEIKIYYPKIDILRTSSGTWKIKNTIKINIPSLNFLDNLKVGSIYQEVAGSIVGFCTLESLQTTRENGNLVAYISVKNLRGSFLSARKTYLKTIVFGAEIIKELSIILQSGNIIKTDSSVLPGGLVANGSWLDEGGKLSSDKVLPDNIYYHDFSYVIKSKVANFEYIEIIKKIAHPSGFRVFGSFSPIVYTKSNLTNIDRVKRKSSLMLGNYLPYNLDCRLDLNRLPIVKDGLVWTASGGLTINNLIQCESDGDCYERAFPNGVIYGRDGQQVDLYSTNDSFYAPAFYANLKLALEKSASLIPIDKYVDGWDGLTFDASHGTSFWNISVDLGEGWDHYEWNNLTINNVNGHDIELINSHDGLITQFHEDDLKQAVSVYDYYNLKVAKNIYRYWVVGIHPNRLMPSNKGQDSNGDPLAFKDLIIGDVINIGEIENYEVE